MISVEYLVLRSNVECTRLTADSETAAQISMDNTAGIKMTLTGDFEINDKVNTLTDRLQVIMHINGAAHPLGKYVICGIEPQTTPAGRRVGSYTAYDLTYLVQSSKTEQRHYIAAGTKYTDALQALLIESGITDFIIEPSDATIRTAREDWEPGTFATTFWRKSTTTACGWTCRAPYAAANTCRPQRRISRWTTPPGNTACCIRKQNR